MPRKLFPLMVAVLSLAAFGAFGCGDDEEPATDAPQQQQQQQETTDGGTPAVPANAEEAVETCKQSIDAQTQVSEDVRNDLKEVCEKAASGDEQDIKDATREVCTKLIEESVPEGPARDQALETCKTATE